MQQKVIQSITDPLIVFAKDLTRLSTRSRMAKYLLFGEKHIHWAIQNNVFIENIFYGPNFLYAKSLQDFLHRKLNCHACSSEVLEYLSEDKSTTVVAVASAQRDLRGELSKNGAILFDKVEEHKKIGEAIEVASRFGIQDTIATDFQFDINYSEVITASEGKALSMRHRSFVDIEQSIQFLRKHNFQIAVVKASADNSLAMSKLQARPIAIVLGHEFETLNVEVEDYADVIVQMPDVQHSPLDAASYKQRFNVLLTMLNQKILLGSKHKDMHMALSDLLKETVWGSEDTVRWFVCIWLATEEKWSEKQWHEVQRIFALEKREEFIKSLFAKLFLKKIGEEYFLGDAGLAHIKEHWRLTDSNEKRVANYLAGLGTDDTISILRRTKVAQEKAAVKFKVPEETNKETEKKTDSKKKNVKKTDMQKDAKDATLANDKAPSKRIGPRERLLPSVGGTKSIRPIGQKS